MSPVDDVPSSPPAADPAPAPEAAPEGFRPEHFQSMLEQIGSSTPISDTLAEGRDDARDEAPPPREPREPREARPAAPTGPRKWAGQFDTPEALETGYRDADQARQRAESDRERAEQSLQRVERLLVSTLQGRPEVDAQGRPQAPPPPKALSDALQIIREEGERIGLADPEANPLRLVHAVATALALDDQARRLYSEPVISDLQFRSQAQGELERLKGAFYTRYPDLRGVREDLLRQVAEDAEIQIARKDPRRYGSAQFMQEWFDETARQARAIFRTSDAGAAPPTAERASGASRPRRDSRAGAAPFAESPTPRPDAPALTGQALHLARVFGGR